MEIQDVIASELNDVPSDEEKPYEFAPTDELWEGGPTFAQIQEWKEKHSPLKVYVVSVSDDHHIVWRTLSRFEYRRLVKNMEQAVATGQVTQSEANLNNEEAIAELCCLYPAYKRQDSAGVEAGVASLIAQMVMEASAFTPLEVREL